MTTKKPAPKPTPDERKPKRPTAADFANAPLLDTPEKMAAFVRGVSPVVDVAFVAPTVCACCGNVRVPPCPTCGN